MPAAVPVYAAATAEVVAAAWRADSAPGLGVRASPCSNSVAAGARPLPSIRRGCARRDRRAASRSGPAARPCRRSRFCPSSSHCPRFARHDRRGRASRIEPSSAPTSLSTAKRRMQPKARTRGIGRAIPFSSAHRRRGRPRGGARQAACVAPPAGGALRETISLAGAGLPKRNPWAIRQPAARSSAT